LLNLVRERYIQELSVINEHNSNINTKKKSEKTTFREITELWNHKEFGKIKRTKLNYQCFNDNPKINAFIKGKSKDEVLEETSIVDLNLIYYILTGNCKEIKKKKEDIYYLITSYQKANKQGEAFSKLIEEK
jgi:hypothetical protein